MKKVFVYTGVVLVTMAGATTALAASGPEKAVPARQEAKAVRLEKRAVLREARHAKRLVRVEGIVRGMTHRLDNLSQRLSRQEDQVKRRLAALKKAGHNLTVDDEAEALYKTIADTQTLIMETKSTLTSLADSETPRKQAITARKLVRSLRQQLKGVREAFHSLRLAVRADVRSSSRPENPSS